MRNRRIRAATAILAVCVLLAGMPVPVQAYNPGGIDYVNTYVNTGNQRQDIIGVALTQVGYMEGDRNDTKYGDWYGLAHDEWCAMFVSWCARQAEVSEDILHRSSWAHPREFKIPEYAGTEYTPQPGDLFFTEKHQHVGLVWYVEGDFFYSIEGNAKPHDYTVPNDPSVESYHVMVNKRLISAHTFGVPEYEGTESGHRYVRGYETKHPHNVHYTCQDCGDRYYTGYNERLAECDSCLPCGCYSGKAGYYELLPKGEYLKLRSGHSWDSKTLGYVTLGSVVYVYGMSGGWAYVDFDGNRGHIPADYLKAYPNPPVAPETDVGQAEYLQQEKITVRWTNCENAEQYRLTLLRNGQTYLQEKLGTALSYTLKDLPAGDYQVQVLACNRAGASEAGTATFRVLDQYTVSYNAGKGTGAPEPQTQLLGQAVTISDTSPTRKDYTFLGWTKTSGGKTAYYAPGDSLLAAENITLYAVWRKDAATPQSLTVEKLPSTTLYLPGDSLDLSGLTLELRYSDGKGCRIKDGYEVSGFDSETLGTKTLTITCGSLSATCQVQVVSHIPGDIDGNRAVNRDDVLQLLLHVSMPEAFPVTVPADFTGDGQVTRDDVLQLLLHVSMPEAFPLQTTTKR